MVSTKSTTNASLPNFTRALPYILIVTGILGLLFAFLLMYDSIKLLSNPHYNPICNLNPILNCGIVINSKESDVFGFSNPILGIAAFPVLITSGVVMLSGVKLKRWFLLALNAGSFVGVIFMHYLFVESVYHIHAVCPYCFGTWVMTITAFWYLTLYNIQNHNLKISKKYRPVTNFIVKHHADWLVLWLLIIVGLILKHFWYYYGQYF
jgi:uncharacterized membrane protein